MEKVPTWVVYSKPQKTSDPALVVCKEAEWEQIDRARPGVNTLVQSGILSESAAERVARGEVDFAPLVWAKRNA